MKHKLTSRVLAVGVLALTLTGGGAAAANAAPSPSTVQPSGITTTVQAGATTPERVNYTTIFHPDRVTPNSSGPYTFASSVSFTAAPNTTFADANVTLRTSNGAGFGAPTSVTGCTLNAAKTVVTCPLAEHTIPAYSGSGVPAITFRSPQATADADAPAGSYETTGTLTIPNDPWLTGGTTTSTVKIIPAADLPIIDPAVGAMAAGAGALALGGVLVARNRRALGRDGS